MWGRHMDPSLPLPPGWLFSTYRVYTKPSVWALIPGKKPELLEKNREGPAQGAVWAQGDGPPGLSPRRLGGTASVTQVPSDHLLLLWDCCGRAAAGSGHPPWQPLPYLALLKGQ